MARKSKDIVAEPPPSDQEILRREAFKEHGLRLARNSYRHFLKHVWWWPHPFIQSLHLRICGDIITKALWDYEAGHTSFWLFQWPFRHGKSDVFSRALIPFFLGRFEELQPSAFLLGYGADHIYRFSNRARKIVASARYQELFPGTRLGQKQTDHRWMVDYWQPKVNAWRSSSGEVIATGFGGTIAGSGYELGVVDDYCKNPEEAESPVYREKSWDIFANDFLARRGPVSVTLVAATPRHEDDIAGRIRKRMEKDRNFPKFHFVTFPAHGPASVDGKRVNYPGEFLFPERYSPEWYQEHYATLGEYASAGLLDCSPTIRGGNRFPVERIQVCAAAPKNIRFVRFWDLASTDAELNKPDPDFTVGALVGVEKSGFVDKVWVADLVYGQWKAPQRDSMIRAVAKRDGQGVKIVVEGVAGYKDTVSNMKEILKGVRSVQGVNVNKDKGVRAAPLEPVFEADNFYLVKAAWNNLLTQQFKAFPNATHDDIVDAVAGGYEFLRKGSLPDPFDRSLIGA